ncbi:unnamed protein product, partial [Coregonus sp. 'balchen']
MPRCPEHTQRYQQATYGRAKQQPVSAYLMSTSVRRRRLPKVGGENAVKRHTQRNKKMLVTARLRMLLDDGYYLELSPFAGMGLPYGDIPSAGCVTGIGQINGLWCVFIANDVTVSGGTAYPITVKKQLRAQDVAIQNRLPCVYLVDSGGVSGLWFMYSRRCIHPHYGRRDSDGTPDQDDISGGRSPLVKGATGEDVSPVWVGPRWMSNWHQVGNVASNGELTHNASLKGSHSVQLCDQRDIPLIFLQNTVPTPELTLSLTQCGRSFDPKFLFPWPNARVSLLTPGQSAALAQEEEDIEKINKRF